MKDPAQAQTAKLREISAKLQSGEGDPKRLRDTRRSIMAEMVQRPYAMTAVLGNTCNASPCGYCVHDMRGGGCFFCG